MLFIHLLKYSILAREPSIAQGIYSYSRRLPALVRKFRFFPVKVENNPVVLPSSSIFKQISQGVQELWLDKQSEITTL